MDVFTLSCAKLPAHTRVMRLSGHEGLSRLYSFTLDLVMPGAEGMTFDMADAVDATATLKIQAEDGSARSTFHGILSTMDWVQEVEDHSIYRVTLVPRLWRLGLNQHSNVFVEKTVQQIVTDVLLSNQLQEGQDFDFCLGATKYEKMPHVAQYRESDLDFLARRLERDGLYYFFEQLDDHERLVITDSKGEHTVSGTVHYYAHTSHAPQGAEALTSFTCRHQVRPKQVKVREYDYLRPTMDLQKVDTVHQHGVGDVVIHDENYTTPGEGQRLATVRAEELKSREVVFEGQGHTFHVRPGYLFELKSHPRQSFNGKYLAVSLTHEGSQGVTSEGTRPEDMQVPTYAVRLEAITSTVQYRPSRVPCIIAVAGFSLITPGAVVLGFFLIALANIGMEGGLVFYNSFLPQIAPKEYQGRVSGWGFGVGYAGSILSLLIALPLAKTGRLYLIWPMVAIFFAVFSLPALLFLPRDAPVAVSPIPGRHQGFPARPGHPEGDPAAA